MGCRPFRIFLEAGDPEDANWSYGDGCGPHEMLKYVRSVQIISSGAVEPAAVPLEYSSEYLQTQMLGVQRMLSGVLKLETEPRALGDLLEVQKMLSGLH